MYLLFELDGFVIFMFAFLLLIAEQSAEILPELHELEVIPWRKISKFNGDGGEHFVELIYHSYCNWIFNM